MISKEESLYKVFVINLEESHQRKANITMEFERIKLPFEFIDAVNGKKLDLSTNKEVDYSAMLRAPEWLTPGMIGCSLSHAKAYQTIVNRNIETALIMEDDCILPDDFQQLVEASAKEIKAFEVIMFYYTSFETCTFSNHGMRELPGGRKLVYPMDIKKPISTTAYMINKETCKSLLSVLFPIHSSPDAWGYFYERKAITSMRCVFPRPVDTADFKSTIGYIKPESVMGHMLKAVDDHKIFPVHHFLKWRRKKFKSRMQQYDFTNEHSTLQPLTQ